MHTRRVVCWGDVRGIEYEVSDLAEENVDSHPIGVLRVVRVTIDQAETLEVGSSLQDGAVGRVTDHLRVVGSDDRRRDEVSSRWEVDHCRGFRRGSLIVKSAILSKEYTAERLQDREITYASLHATVVRVIHGP